MIAWTFFRSESISASFIYLNNILSKFSIPSYQRSGLIFVFIIIGLDWMWRINAREPLNKKNKYIRWPLYLGIMYMILGHVEIIDLSQFIYFQF